MNACCNCATTGPFDLVMRVAPQPVRPPVALPVIGNPDPADESELAVHHEDLAMRAVIDAREMDEPKNLHVYARAFQFLHGATVDRVAPERVLQEMHFYPGPRALRQRRRERVRDFALPSKENSRT